MTDDLIARAEAALEGVSPGPWQSEWPLDGDDDFPPRYVASAVTTQCSETAVAMLRADQFADASFIAAARELVSEMKAHIAAQAAEIARLRAERPDLWRAGRDAAAGSVMAAQRGFHDGIAGGWHPYSVAEFQLFARNAIRALTPPDTEDANLPSATPPAEPERSPRP